MPECPFRRVVVGRDTIVGEAGKAGVASPPEFGLDAG